jgi:nitrate reductase delta subunit
LAYLKSRPLIRVQEEYIETFDMNTAMSLNLTYHLVGDGKKRGAALASLLQVYREAGYEPLLGELPDYLPVMLEFWSLCPAEVFREMAVAYRKPLATLAAGLQEVQSPYAGLLRLAGELLDVQIKERENTKD